MKAEPFSFEAASVELFRQLARQLDHDAPPAIADAAAGRRAANGRHRSLPVIVTPTATPGVLNQRKFQGA